ncbi:MAG TPA: hypothetical protein VL094_12750 [Sphingomonadaceae bacterium]|nr:hypothetical protein [Sphingomonadaceae bacterium]
MRRLLLLASAALLASCGKEPAEEHETIDTATVEKALRGKAVPVELQPIRLPDIEKHKLYGTSCAFAPEGGGLGAVAMAMEDAGYLKIGKEVLRYAADKGSAELPFGTRTQYDGRINSFDLLPDGGAAPAQSGTSVTFPGRLIVRDTHERVVYDQPGEIQCNRGPAQ